MYINEDKIVLLKKLYIEQKLSLPKISKVSIDFFGIFLSTGAIYNLMKDNGIKTRTISESCSTLNTHESYLDEKTIEWVDGFLLGDGSIGHNKITFKSARFSIGSSEEQWANYAMSGFKKYNPREASSKGWKFRIEKPSKPTFSSCSKTHPDIVLQAKRWYPNGKKIVPLDVRITPISILLWYLGDGSVGRHKKNEQLMCTNASLATCGFTPEENNNILIPKLAKMGIRCLYGRSKNDIIVCSDSMRTFFNTIGRKSPISCYDYKFEIPQWLFLKTLKMIMPNIRDRWRAVYYIRKGEISHSESPGGHYFLFNPEQEKELLKKCPVYDGALFDKKYNV